MPIAHYHESWDETIYGLAGESTWRLDGRGRRAQTRSVHLHQARDRSRLPQRCAGGGELSLHPDARRARTRLFSLEIAALMAEGAPDLAKMKDIMLRHGLHPAPQ